MATRLHRGCVALLWWRKFKKFHNATIVIETDVNILSSIITFRENDPRCIFGHLHSFGHTESPKWECDSRVTAQSSLLAQGCQVACTVGKERGSWKNMDQEIIGLPDDLKHNVNVKKTQTLACVRKLYNQSVASLQHLRTSCGQRESTLNVQICTVIIRKFSNDSNFTA